MVPRTVSLVRRLVSLSRPVEGRRRRPRGMWRSPVVVSYTSTRLVLVTTPQPPRITQLISVQVALTFTSKIIVRLAIVVIS